MDSLLYIMLLLAALVLPPEDRAHTLFYEANQPATRTQLVMVRKTGKDEHEGSRYTVSVANSKSGQVKGLPATIQFIDNGLYRVVDTSGQSEGFELDVIHYFMELEDLATTADQTVGITTQSPIRIKRTKSEYRIQKSDNTGPAIIVRLEDAKRSK